MAGLGTAEVNSLVVRSKCYKYQDPQDLPPFDLKPEHEEANKFYYGFRIVNGKMDTAGTTNSKVYFNLVGENAQTGSLSFYDSWLEASKLSTGNSAEASDGNSAEASNGNSAEASNGNSAEASNGNSAEASNGNSAEASTRNSTEACPGIIAEVSPGISAKTYIDFIVQTEKSLGEVLVVIVGIDGGIVPLYSTWFVNYTVVYVLKSQDDGVTLPGIGGPITFPCYHWIGKDTSVSTTANTTTINDVKDNAVLIRERTIHLDKMREQYKWQLSPNVGLPSAIDGSVFQLPMDEQFGRMKGIDFTQNILDAVSRALPSLAFVKMDTLEDYFSLNNLEQKSEVELLTRAGRWSSDVEFGRQILNGVNPVVIRKCPSSIPAKFHVTNDMVQQFLTRGKNLEEEIQDGRVYICDLEIMNGLPTRAGQFVSAPICLLYVNSSDQLVPIAIQLRQGVRKEEEEELRIPVFVPSDGWYDWLLAKIYYQSAHAQFHQLCTHFLSCHAVMEGYSMATARNLPWSHPISKLLLPHFRYTMAINSLARETLINRGGIIDRSFAIGGDGVIEFFKRASKIYSVDWTNIKKNVKERGVDNAEQLPGYYYRDDGIKLFNVLEDYVREVVNVFYASDADVVADTEIQSWVSDIYCNAFPGYFGGTLGHDFPAVISTKDVLIERCTVIMFTGSCQHAAVNFGQFHIFGFCPNAPFTLRCPPPPDKGMADQEMLLKTLPDKMSALTSITITYVLAQFSRDEIFLGHYPAKRFLEKQVQQSIDVALEKVKEIEEEIGKRNKSLDVPYTYLLPTKIPNSITI